MTDGTQIKEGSQ